VSWVVFDYGNVISAPQSAVHRAAIEACAGIDPARLWERYWGCREDYDRGIATAAQFWSAVTDRALLTHEVAALTAEDAASWSTLSLPALAAIEALAARGQRLALLSNAPVEVARHIETLPVLAQFSPRLFSCDVGLTKPDPAIFALLLARLGSPPSEVTFLDDRSENVAAATASGLRARLVDGPSVFSAL
jgi:putative hydrolase of the HAD superfamily